MWVGYCGRVMDDSVVDQDSRGKRLGELARLFLRLGATAFGGPAAHVSIMEDEIVRRRKWVSREQFLDLLGAVNLIPGPNSTEMAIHIGYLRAGVMGLIVAGSCFILPAVIIVGAMAWAYVKFGRLPQVSGILYGVKPVVIAIIAQALWRLGRSAVKTPFLGMIAVIAAAASWMGVNELIVLFGAAAIVPVWRVMRGNMFGGAMVLAPLPLGGVATTGAVMGSAGLGPMFLVFLKIGSVLFGSGYVLLAFLRADLVERLGWLTEAQLLDATAVGQVTPGPVFTTATFIGYLLSGWKGAAVATVGIFLPAFFFVAISAPFVHRMRQSATAGAFLDGLNVASLALMGVVTVQLGHAGLVDWITIGMAGVSLMVLLLSRVNSTWLILAGAGVGVIKLV